MKITWKLLVLVFVFALIDGTFWFKKEMKQRKTLELEQEKRETTEKNTDNKIKIIQSTEVKASIARMLKDVPKNHPIWQVADLVTSTDEIAPLPSVDTSSWELYRNEKAGFEVKIPMGWEAESRNVINKYRAICFFEPNRKAKDGKIIDGVMNDESYLDYEICIRSRYEKADFIDEVRSNLEMQLDSLTKTEYANEERESASKLISTEQGFFVVKYFYVAGSYADVFGENVFIRISYIYDSNQVVSGMLQTLKSVDSK